MKLNKKFTLLVIWLGIQTVLLSLLLIFMFNKVFQLKDFQSKLADAQYSYERISGFASTIDARGVDMDTMYSDWTTRLENAKVLFLSLHNHKARSFMNEDMNEQVDSLGSLWDSIEGQLTDLTDVYKQLASATVSSMFKNTVRQSGFKNAITMYQDTEDVSNVEFQMNSVRIKEGALYYAYDSFTQVVDSLSDAMTELVNTERRISNILMLSLTILATFLMVFIVRVTTRSMTKRISAIQKMTTRLAQKDFTVRGQITVKDEVGDLQRDLNDTVAHLNDIFASVKNSAQQVQSSGQSISESAEETAAATHQINKSVESISRQFDILNGSVNRSLEAIKQMSSISTVLVHDNSVQAQSIVESNNAVDEMAKTLENISGMASEKTQSAEEMQKYVIDGDDKISATNSLLKEITSQLDEVSEIVTIINAIAEQTNLLSMNAAIESAHAGEAGKGFSVVAEEIRTLAEGTGENAKRITNSIYAIIDKVQEANNSSGDASQAFTKVSESVRDMLSSLHEISNGIARIDEKSESISSRSGEISATADKISGYCEKLTVQQNNVSTEMSAMHDIFTESMNGISEIKQGTEDIVQRMRAVSDMSSNSRTQMTELDTVLSEFVTTSTVEMTQEETVKPEAEPEPEAGAEEIKAESNS